MSIVAYPECLDSLVKYLNSLESRVSMERLRQELDGLDVCADDLIAYMQFGDLCYRRNLICEGPWHELLCICWHSGQRSPIHNHAHSTCGLRVIRGIATETTFDLTPCGQIKPIQSVDLHPGFVCCTQDADIHQVSNLQSADQDLITLHIYSPPLRTMDTYSITGGETGTYTVR